MEREQNQAGVEAIACLEPAKKRSTRFIQDEEVGVKWDLKRRWRFTFLSGGWAYFLISGAHPLNYCTQIRMEDNRDRSTCYPSRWIRTISASRGNPQANHRLFAALGSRALYLKNAGDASSTQFQLRPQTTVRQAMQKRP
ncbi:MAG: hypothetical protein ACLP1W_18880 [Rhodomicrobium sp.]